MGAGACGGSGRTDRSMAASRAARESGAVLLLLLLRVVAARPAAS